MGTRSIKWGHEEENDQILRIANQAEQYVAAKTHMITIEVQTENDQLLNVETNLIDTNNNDHHEGNENNEINDDEELSIVS